jgi:iron complex outermembrane receptor protein
MQKPGYNPHSGVVPTLSDPNLIGVDVFGLPDDWNSMSNVDYRDSDTESLSAWLDYKLNDDWSLRAGYSWQKYEIDALFSGNFGMANNTRVCRGAA